MASLVVALATTTAVCAPASAYSATRSVSGGWITTTVYFNRTETVRIAGGGTVCAAILSKVPIAWVPCAVVQGYAGIAVMTGACVAVVEKRNYAPGNNRVVYPTYHRGTRCG